MTQNAILNIDLPPDYQHAQRTNKLFVSLFKMDRNPEDFPTQFTFRWALAQDMKAAYRHSMINKTHWVLVTTFDGERLHSAPGFQELT